jgi:hypothetical protein
MNFDRGTGQGPREIGVTAIFAARRREEGDGADEAEDRSASHREPPWDGRPVGERGELGIMDNELETQMLRDCLARSRAKLEEEETWHALKEILVLLLFAIPFIAAVGLWILGSVTGTGVFGFIGLLLVASLIMFLFD